MHRNLFFLLLSFVLFQNVLLAQDPVGTSIQDIGSKRQLFIDDHLIDHSQGEVELNLDHPVPQGIAIEFDEPWEDD